MKKVCLINGQIIEKIVEVEDIQEIATELKAYSNAVEVEINSEVEVGWIFDGKTIHAQ